ncbi:MAG: hypothetical protein AAF217_04220, partial [Pseudomonadota bacterium]
MRRLSLLIITAVIVTGCANVKAMRDRMANKPPEEVAVTLNNVPVQNPANRKKVVLVKRNPVPESQPPINSYVFEPQDFSDPKPIIYEAPEETPNEPAQSSTPVTEPLVIEAPKITEDTPADDVAATDVSANKVVAEPEASPPT